MKDGKVRLLQLLLEEFITEQRAKDKCVCSECLGRALCNWFYPEHGVIIQ